jgi:PRTRC genetic system ThiF family protein
MKHPLPTHFVEQTVRVALAGAGGNGSQMLSGLARMHTALTALGHPGLDVTVFDPDIVTDANIGRQLFSPSDADQYKAEVLVNRINCFFNLNWSARPVPFTHGSGGWDLLIGCVDSAAARRELDRASWNYWLDLGNSERKGQVVLGQKPKGKRSFAAQTARNFKRNLTQKEKAADAAWQKWQPLPTIMDLFPELKNRRRKVDNTPQLLAGGGAGKTGPFHQPVRRHLRPATALVVLSPGWLGHSRLLHQPRNRAGNTVTNQMNLKLKLRTFLQRENASVRLFNQLANLMPLPGSPTGRLTLSQFIAQWPLERLRKEVYGFGPKAQAELLEILERQPNSGNRRFMTYVASLRPTAPQCTCVYCGCTDSRACEGGCFWTEKHRATPTGVCSRCVSVVQNGPLRPFRLGNFIFTRTSPLNVFIQNHAGEGMQTTDQKIMAGINPAITKFFNEEF